MKLLGFLDPEAIVTDLSSTNKEEVIGQLVEETVKVGGIAKADQEAVIEQVLARESKGSTGLGGGIALPHVKGSQYARGLCGAFGRSEAGVDFKAIDGRPVHALFLILSSVDDLDEHTSILRRISKVRENEHYLSSFQKATDQEALAKLIEGLGGAA